MGVPILTAVAWPYANGPRHIGHVSGFGVPSDVFSRYMRMRGEDVLMVSGTDEHGTPILVQADEQGVPPKEIADRYNTVIAKDLCDLGLSYDLFTRTTTVNHKQVTQEMFRTLHRNGYLQARTTLGAVSPSTGRTLPDRFIEGTCPICGYDGARGDQCDNCGNQLDPVDLKNPRSWINGETPAFVQTEQFFLDLPQFADALGSWLMTRKDWRPNVLKFSMNLLSELRPRAMTRDINWGVPVPISGWEDNPDKRLYVWFDAVIGYLSASIEWSRRTGDGTEWRRWWCNPEARSYYFMGKDNITFHSQIWPAILLGYNGRGTSGGQPGTFGELELPTEVVSSEFLTMEGRKFSSSWRVAIYVGDMLSRYDVDSLRYYIAAAGPETQDTDFTWAEFFRRTNDELVAGWGNLVHRTLSMISRNFGSIPVAGPLIEADVQLLAASRAAFDEVGQQITLHRQRSALNAIMRIVSDANGYLSNQEPWKLAGSDRGRMATVLHVAAQTVSDCNRMLAPFLPHSAQRVHVMMGGQGQLTDRPGISAVEDLDGGDPYNILTTARADAGNRGWTSIPISAVALGEVTPLFRKLDISLVDEELDRLATQAS